MCFLFFSFSPHILSISTTTVDNLPLLFKFLSKEKKRAFLYGTCPALSYPVHVCI